MKESYRRQNIEECGYPYKFSVVMAVYKVEEYIREAVDSLLNQTMDFERNTQLIMVDDGSPDNSGTICDEYKERYPDNVIVIHKENGGVSSARNAGLPYIEGRYVNFLDADDMLSENTLDEVYLFFSSNEEYVDVAAIPQIIFGEWSGPHSLNYRFDKGSRIIDLKCEYKSMQMSLTSAFVTFAASQKMCFDEHLMTAEDGKEIAKILIHKQKIGVVSTCTHHYRKRMGENLSATQNSMNTKNWYGPYLKNFSLWLYNHYETQLGYIPLFAQYIVMQDIQYKIKIKKIPENVLTQEEEIDFFNLLREVLSRTNDAIILEQKVLNIEHKYFLLSLKYDREPEMSLSRDSALLSYENTLIHKVEDGYTYIDFINIEDGMLKIEGFLVVFGIFENSTAVLRVNGALLETKPVGQERDVYSLGKKISSTSAFVGLIPLYENVDIYEISICCRLVNGAIIKRKKITYGKFAPITASMKNSYRYISGWKLTADESTIYLKKCNAYTHVMSELRLLRTLFSVSKPGAKRAAVTRSLCFIIKPFIRKKIWLISDRISKADDNGEALFRYMRQKHYNKIRYYFCISKYSSDFARLKKAGRVINIFGWYYKFNLLLGAVSVSSHADNEYTNPFPWSRQYYSDLLHNSKYVFLQHGVTKDDPSRWLNRYNTNINIFITTTRQEYSSLLSYNYYYDIKQVRLTGMPRYDYLYNEPKKQITIMPTWRRSLVTNHSADGIRHIKIGFRQSAFFKFYNALLNSSNLLNEAEELGFKICFAPHPNMRECMDLVEKDERVIFMENEVSYRRIFAESNMIV
ncbi:MAG: bifunctional glycosyltransferase family 2 protein/CDP-glycerol:glycerophosphate glycerophosphotransferase, partial [Clostridiales bacterium]|nr:bifunctional glycosyltransferase family 2 protein/CDP-glycerol:glycerophosphate glycerophosphotransferase [Clostridiales bacterium]